jgi:hypothetical protein
MLWSRRSENSEHLSTGQKNRYNIPSAQTFRTVEVIRRAHELNQARQTRGTEILNKVTWGHRSVPGKPYHVYHCSGPVFTELWPAVVLAQDVFNIMVTKASRLRGILRQVYRSMAPLAFVERMLPQRCSANSQLKR